MASFHVFSLVATVVANAITRHPHHVPLLYVFVLARGTTCSLEIGLPSTSSWIYSFRLLESSVLARTGSTGKLPVGAARCRLKVGKQPILPVVLGTSRYCVLIPKPCYYNMMAKETAYTCCPSHASSIRCHLTAVFSVASLVGHPRQSYTGFFRDTVFALA